MTYSAAQHIASRTPLMRWVALCGAARLSAPAYRVLLELVTFGNHDGGRLFAGVELLADLTKMDPHDVRAGLRDLVAAGVLKALERAPGQRAEYETSEPFAEAERSVSRRHARRLRRAVRLASTGGQSPDGGAFPPGGQSSQGQGDSPPSRTGGQSPTEDGVEDGSKTDDRRTPSAAASGSASPPACSTCSPEPGLQSGARPAAPAVRTAAATAAPPTLPGIPAPEPSTPKAKAPRKAPRAVVSKPKAGGADGLTRAFAACWEPLWLAEFPGPACPAGCARARLAVCRDHGREYTWTPSERRAAKDVAHAVREAQWPAVIRAWFADGNAKEYGAQLSRLPSKGNLARIKALVDVPLRPRQAQTSACTGDEWQPPPDLTATERDEAAAEARAACEALRRRLTGGTAA